eukprot:CAMPEP_0197251864 /NCGR_PEP_ID=MMETSP1429-20130617/58909_1 /TAXON_ID=49237 /ORGANISM="Chaetoceros  sp., Strain UNC1202" /LENGTH=55 /DNA_ID=CAMNT_0042714075 /DNA_START=27 /DNA_END=191 /DNA_ORIENTATION=-
MILPRLHSTTLSLVAAAALLSSYEVYGFAPISATLSTYSSTSRTGTATYMSSIAT